MNYVDINTLELDEWYFGYSRLRFNSGKCTDHVLLFKYTGHNSYYDEDGITVYRFLTNADFKDGKSFVDCPPYFAVWRNSRDSEHIGTYKLTEAELLLFRVGDTI